MVPTNERARDFLGFQFAAMSAESALAAIAARAGRKEPFGFVTTPNVDHVVGLAREPARAALYQAAWLTLNDSRVLELLARFDGRALPAAPGADIAARLFEEEISPHEPVTIIGGDSALVEALAARYGLTNIRWHEAPRNLRHRPDAVADAAAFIATQPSRFAFICVGAPQQEMIAWATAMRGDAQGVGLCLGASLEFLAGRRRRAPRWLQRARLEWAFRLAQEPRRMWRRYLIEGPRVFALFMAQRAASRASISARVAA